MYMYIHAYVYIQWNAIQLEQGREPCHISASWRNVEDILLSEMHHSLQLQLQEWSKSERESGKVVTGSWGEGLGGFSVGRVSALQDQLHDSMCTFTTTTELEKRWRW